MKTSVYTLIISIFLGFSSFAQNATNFNVTSCSGVNFDLFNTLDAGKVVVIGWTMPCGSCVLPLKTTYNVVQSYQSTHPERVMMLMVDDYANTPCASIELWANSNGMPNTLKFSNPAIKMMDYGSNGMPKVVVIGGSERRVFYNANNAVDHVALQQAINNAISVVTAINESTATSSSFKAYPNPAQNIVNIDFSLQKPDRIQISLFNDVGQEVKVFYSDVANEGLNQFEISTENLANGLYHIQLKHSKGVEQLKFNIVK
jgi:hypothetical protein